MILKALAAIPTPSGLSNLPDSPIQTVNDVQDSIASVLVWIFWGAIALSIVMFLVGAYRYVTSAGDPEKVKTANRTLLYAAIGVAVALVASGVPALVGSFLGV